MTRRSAARSCEDIDEVVLQYAEFKALAVSDPQIKRKMEVDNEIYRLQTLKSAWKTEHATLQQNIMVHYPDKIQKLSAMLERQEKDTQTYESRKSAEFSITLNNRPFEERSKAGEYLKLLLQTLGREEGSILKLGDYAGFSVSAKREYGQGISLYLEGRSRYSIDAGDSAIGNITRLENLAGKIESYKDNTRKELEEVKTQLEAAREQAGKPFAEEESLAELLQEQVALNLELEFSSTGKKGAAKGAGIYRKLHRLAPELLAGRYTYMKFRAECFDDLVMERIGDGEYSMAHYYMQEGDCMRDPEITFKVDLDGREAIPLSYQQDNMRIYYRTCDRSEEENNDLMDFWNQWLTNIREQGFDLYAAHGEKEEFHQKESIMEEAAER